MKLCIALATRNRPALLLSTLARTLPNIVRADTALHVMVDDDDAPTREALEKAYSQRVVIDVRAREDTVGEKFNRVLSTAADVYLVMVDHTPHITKGFDQKILDAAAIFPDGIGVVYNNLVNASFPSTNAVTRKFADLTGYIYPSYFPYWFVDHWFDDIARLCDRIAFADIATDSSRKPETQELREPAWWATFYDAGYRLRRDIAHRIILSPELDEPDWRRKILTTHHPLIETRSRWVNNQVRILSDPLEKKLNLPHDERYRRIRAKAVAMIPQLVEKMDSKEAWFYRDALLPRTAPVRV